MPAPSVRPEEAPRTVSDRGFAHAGFAELPPHLHPRGQPGRRGGRVLAGLAGGLSVTVLLVSVGLYGLYLHYNGRIDRIQGLIRPGGHQGAAAQAGVENVLLVGSDDRTALSQQQLAQAHTAQDGGAINTDVLIILHIDPRTSKVDMISFPRDSYVPVPGWTNTDGTPDYERINAIYALTGVRQRLSGQAAKDAGARKLVESIEGYSGLHIDHYVQINFGGFLDITQALGGVTVCLQHAHNDPNSGAVFPAGTVTLTAEQALAFVRERKDLPGGDLDRIKRQQVFFSAVLRKAESPDTFLNPVKLNAVLTAVTSSITTDGGLSLADVKDLTDRLKQLDPGHLSFFTVPVGAAFFTPDGANVLRIDLNQWHQFFARFSDAPPATPTPIPRAGTARVTIPPGQITVQVQNGNGGAHLGATVAQALAADGFQTVPAVDADRSDYAHSEVRYSPSRADSARTVAVAVPGAVLVPDASAGDTVVLIVGRDYTVVRPVTVGAAAPANPGPTTAAPTLTGPAPINAPAAAGSSAANQGCAP